MKPHILSMRVLAVMLLIFTTLSGCDLGKTFVVNPSEQKEVIKGYKELQQVEIEQKESSKFPPRVFTYQEAKELYIQEFGKPTVDIKRNSDGSVYVEVTTKRTILTSAKIEEADLYHKHIYNSKDVMTMFANGVTRDLKCSQGRLSTWKKRLEQGNPFAGMTARLRSDQVLKEGTVLKANEFLGNVVLGGSEEGNSSELAYFLRKDSWNNRFGTEIVGAVVLFVAAKLAEEGYKLPNNDQEFKRTIATTRIDNTASKNILDHLGMRVYTITKKFGNDRYHYELDMKEVH